MKEEKENKDKNDHEGIRIEGIREEVIGSYLLSSPFYWDALRY